MRYVLLSIALLILSPHRVAADHFGIYSDGTGVACNLGPTGFNPNATVVHKYTFGATGSRFKVTLPAGSVFFGFNTPYIPSGVLTSDLSLGYGQCLNGSIPLGTITAIYTQGTLCVRPADGLLNVIFSDCAFVETAATGGPAYVGITGPCYFQYEYATCQGIVVATDQKTWGAVKSLYRE